METFIASAAFQGAKPGYVFKTDFQGLGYYKDVKPIPEGEYAVPGGTSAISSTTVGGQQSTSTTAGGQETYNKYANDGTYYSKIKAMLNARRKAGEQEMPGSPQKRAREEEVEDPLEKAKRQALLSGMAQALS